MRGDQASPGDVLFEAKREESGQHFSVDTILKELQGEEEKGIEVEQKIRVRGAWNCV